MYSYLLQLKVTTVHLQTDLPYLPEVTWLCMYTLLA